MSDEDIIREELSEFITNDKEYLESKAIAGEFRTNRKMSYRKVLGIVFDTSNYEEPITEEFTDLQSAKEWAKEMVHRSFATDTQSKRIVRLTWMESYSEFYYDCDKYERDRALRILQRENQIKNRLETEREKKHRAETWERACEWASNNGIRVMKRRDGTIGCNKKQTIVRKVIEKDKVSEWNALFPEFEITDSYKKFVMGVRT